MCTGKKHLSLSKIRIIQKPSQKTGFEQKTRWPSLVINYTQTTTILGTSSLDLIQPPEKHGLRNGRLQWLDGKKLDIGYSDCKCISWWLRHIQRLGSYPQHTRWWRTLTPQTEEPLLAGGLALEWLVKHLVKRGETLTKSWRRALKRKINTYQITHYWSGSWSVQCPSWNTTCHYRKWSWNGSEWSATLQSPQQYKDQLSCIQTEKVWGGSSMYWLQRQASAFLTCRHEDNQPPRETKMSAKN